MRGLRGVGWRGGGRGVGNKESETYDAQVHWNDSKFARKLGLQL